MNFRTGFHDSKFEFRIELLNYAKKRMRHSKTRIPFFLSVSFIGTDVFFVVKIFWRRKSFSLKFEIETFLKKQYFKKKRSGVFSA